MTDHAQTDTLALTDAGSSEWHRSAARRPRRWIGTA